MTETRRFSLLVTATLLVATVTACANDSTADPTTAPSPSGTVSQSTAPTMDASPSDSDAASKAAEAVVRRHFEVLDRLRQQPKRPIKELATVSVGTQLNAEKRLVQSERDKGYKQQGATKVVDLKVDSVNLDNSDPKAGKVPTVTVTVCWDVSAVDVLDKQGKSVVTAERPDRGRTRYLVSNYQWDKKPDDGWRIASGETLEKSPCSGS